MNNKLKKKLISLSVLFSLGTSIVFLSPSQLVAHAEETGEGAKTEEVKTETETKTEVKKEEEKPSVKEVEEKIKIEAPASVTGQKTEGQGTVVDFSTSNTKNFFTIQDKEGNTFYLIIDMEKTENNVYFVSDVNKTHLEQGVATQNDKAPINQAVVQQQQETQQNEVATDNTQAPETNKKDGNNNFIKLVLGGFIAVLLGYYMFIFKKKKGSEPNKDSKENQTEAQEDNAEKNIENLHDNPDEVIGYAGEETVEEGE